jgi:hypothetical protein
MLISSIKNLNLDLFKVQLDLHIITFYIRTSFYKHLIFTNLYIILLVNLTFS